MGFNSQPPEGGWSQGVEWADAVYPFQLTAARRRLGASKMMTTYANMFQLTAARRRLVGGDGMDFLKGQFQLTAARRRLAEPPALVVTVNGFQLTAARRRLARTQSEMLGWETVSTHSRPKAAGFLWPLISSQRAVSTHSRPKAAGQM